MGSLTHENHRILKSFSPWERWHESHGGLHTATQLVLEPLKSYPFLPTTPNPPLVRSCFFATPVILPNYAVPFSLVRRPTPEHLWKRAI